MPLFDEKFGAHFLATVPSQPGVYLFADEKDQVIYVGKAKNLQRRLASYRTPTRRKRHAKMRKIVKAAMTLQFELCETEENALLREDILIKTHRPVFNEAGAFFSTYPALGCKALTNGDLELCRFHAKVERDVGAQGFVTYGAFRDRLATEAAFDALSCLFSLIGHDVTDLKRRYRGLPRGTSLAAFRRVDASWVARLDLFLKGESDAMLASAVDFLLERPPARRKSPLVEESLKALRYFFHKETVTLAEARRLDLHPAGFVAGEDRDRLAISIRMRGLDVSSQR